jgi:hypothetical protein
VPLPTRQSALRFSSRLLLLAVLILSCKPPVPAPVAIAVRARGDRGAPTPNVEIYSGTLLVARTAADGRASLDVNGAEGETFDLQVKCPTGFASPPGPLSVRRVDIGATSTIPEYAVTCHETRRALVVVVRADGGPSLPLLYLGKEVARTDGSGSAHVLFEGDVHDRVELTLSTAGKENEKMHPQNPAQVFEVPDRDAIQLFAVSFTRDKKKPPPSRPAPHGPTKF